MPTIRANDVDLHYVESGAGPQTVVFSHSFVADHRQFEGQIRALEQEYRVIAYDHRDHGRSGHAKARYALADIVADAEAVIEQTNAKPCHFVGLSTGGFVGMRLALTHPELLRSLVLMDTSAQREPLYKQAKYQAMFLALRALGVGPMIGATMRAMFGRSTLRDSSRQDELRLWSERFAENDPHALIRFGNAIFGRDDVLRRMNTISMPTLVMVGQEDRSLPPNLSRRMAEAIPGAILEVIAGAGHLSTIERPDAVNAKLLPFIASAS